MKLNIIALLCALLLALGFSFGLSAGPIVDTDLDGIINQLDNCQTVANVDQFDSDCDGYGALCDVDCNNNFVSFVGDFALMGAPGTWGANTPFGTPAGVADPCLDVDNDGIVFVGDYAILGGPSTWGKSTGPSGYGCAGTTPCASTAVARACR